MTRKPPLARRVVFAMGGPGAGVATQCAKLAAERGEEYVHVRVGDVLRRAGEEGVDADDDAENLALQVVAQKPKTGADDRSAVSIVGVPSQQPHPKKGMNRTSSLDAPIMLLEGHGDAVNSIKFSPDGATVASCGADRRCSCGTFAATARCADPPPISHPRCPYVMKPYFCSPRPSPLTAKPAASAELHDDARTQELGAGAALDRGRRQPPHVLPRQDPTALGRHHGQDAAHPHRPR